MLICILGVASKLQLSGNMLLFKKIHIFYTIFMEFGQNNLPMSKSLSQNYGIFNNSVFQGQL